MGHLKAHKDQLQLNRSQKNLRRDAGHAIADFNMIADGDLIMVCLSGGKDSYTLLEILRNLQKHAPIDFKLHVVNLDQKQPGFPSDVLPDYLSDLGADYKIIEKDTYSIVTDKISEDKTYCGLCSRLRRGILYNYAEEIGADKIALGHHRDDIIETLFLNMFFGGKLKAMPPKLLSDDKRNVIIRPLAYCKEKEIIKFSNLMNFPIIPCNLCGSQTNLQRQAIKKMLKDWDQKFPGRVETIFRSISNISLSQLADINLFPFGDLKKRLNDSGGINVVDLH
jgi:tRNA 2-thiocytidine biosynthesis protein TtcA